MTGTNLLLTAGSNFPVDAHTEGANYLLLRLSADDLNDGFSSMAFLHDGPTACLIYCSDSNRGFHLCIAKDNLLRYYLPCSCQVSTELCSPQEIFY
jgi:hypothetical protein